jgi:hypothetical protein
MVVPQLTPVMLWTTLMVKCPLYIADSDVPFPGWLDLETYRERSRHVNNAAPDQQWMVWLDAIHLYAKEGRLVQSVLNVFKFCLAVTLWRTGSKQIDDTTELNLWAALSLSVLMPYCFVLSLRLIIYAGKALDIKDKDVGFKPSKPQDQNHQEKRESSFPFSLSLFEHQDEIPKQRQQQQQQQRQSVVLDFGSTYSSSSDRYSNNKQGDVELVEQTISPLPAAATAYRLSQGDIDQKAPARLTPGP